MRPFNQGGEFAGGTPQSGAALKNLAVRGAGLTVVSSALSLVIQLAATVVLARILAPRDFGLVAMVTTFSLLLSNCGVNGITEAIIQQEKLNRTLAGNLFWINLCCGVLLTAAFAAAGTLLAKFYGEPLIAQVARGVSLSILFTCVSVVHLALLKRDLCFSALAKNDVIAKAVSVAVAIALGCTGWGYWALVASVCVLPLSSTIGAFILCPWIPGPPRTAAATRGMMKFAMYTYGRFGVNYFARNVDNLLVGWRFGAPALGFYKKAYDLFSLPASQLVSSISVVAVAALSRARENSVQFRQYLLAIMAVTTFLGMWIAGDLTLIGRDLIRVLLGPGWDEAGKIFTWFAPGIGVMMLYGTHGWIHLSIGRADRWLRWGLIEWAVTILLFIAAIHWGPRGIAAAWCASFWILTLPAMSFAGAPIRLGANQVFAAVWRYIAAAMVAAGVTLVVIHSLAGPLIAEGIAEAVLRIVLVSIVFSALYVVVVIGLYRGTSSIKRLAKIIRMMATTNQEEVTT